MPHREKARKFMAANGHADELKHVNVRSVDQKSGEKAVMRGEIGKVPAGVTMTPEGLARGGIAGKRMHKPRRPAGAGIPVPPAAPPDAQAVLAEPDGDEGMPSPQAAPAPGGSPFKRGGRC